MRHIITVIFIFASTYSFCQTKKELDSLTRLLGRVSVDDQKYRLEWDSTIQKFSINSPQFIDLIKKMNFQDSVNMLLVGNILDKYGWLSIDETSETANETLFLVLQHASLQSQLKYLPLMKQAVADKKAKAAHYALLVDRTNMYQGKFQIYGSQLNYDKKGNLHIFPIIDEPNVDKRRKSVGLPPMQEYLKLSNQPISYKLPTTDKYKNKIVIIGSIIDKQENQPLAKVSIYLPIDQRIGISDINGFFQILVGTKDRNDTITFKKYGYETLKLKLDNNSKQIIEVNPVLTKK